MLLAPRFLPFARSAAVSSAVSVFNEMRLECGDDHDAPPAAEPVQGNIELAGAGNPSAPSSALGIDAVGSAWLAFQAQVSSLYDNASSWLRDAAEETAPAAAGAAEMSAKPGSAPDVQANAAWRIESRTWAEGLPGLSAATKGASFAYDLDGSVFKPVVPYSAAGAEPQSSARWEGDGRLVIRSWDGNPGRVPTVIVHTLSEDGETMVVAQTACDEAACVTAKRWWTRCRDCGDSGDL